jgi:hypothetical protein
MAPSWLCPARRPCARRATASVEGAAAPPGEDAEGARGRRLVAESKELGVVARRRCRNGAGLCRAGKEESRWRGAPSRGEEGVKATRGRRPLW